MSTSNNKEFLKYSLSNKRKIALLFTQSSTKANSAYLLKYISMQKLEEEKTQWLLCISKAVLKDAKKAVLRNKYKRITRNLLREIYPSLKSNYCFALFPSSHFLNFLIQKKEKNFINYLRV